jgi:hypothetical protein
MKHMYLTIYILYAFIYENMYIISSDNKEKKKDDSMLMPSHAPEASTLMH